MKVRKTANSPIWEVPYLPIDPQDVGRSYEAIIRINSQSGKGGIAYILQADYGLNLPRNLQVEFREIIQNITDDEGKELPSKRIHEEFQALCGAGRRPYQVCGSPHYPDPDQKGRRILTAEITDNGVTRRISKAKAQGPIDGFIDALSKPSRREDVGYRLFRAFTQTGFGCSRYFLC